MIRVEAYFSIRSLEHVAYDIKQLADAPTTYSRDEDSRLFAIKNSSIAELIIKNNGLFLWAQHCSFEFLLSSTGTCSLYVFSDNQDQASNIFSAVTKFDIDFAFACSDDERLHRNQISTQMQYGIHEAWVGRDFRRYLPGIYWMTLIPEIYSDLIPPGRLTIGNATVVKYDSGKMRTIIKLYDDADDWVNYVTAIDDWCYQRPNCFSINRVKDELTGRRSFLEISEIVSRWP